MGKVPIREWQISTACNMLEYRGLDATGVALMNNDGDIEVIKNNDPAWRFTSSKSYAEFMKKHLSEKTRIVLVHTRKYTKGSPARNDNNHPMIGNAGAIVHNGMIYNDDALFEANKGRQGFKRSGETDSDVIRALMDFNGGIDEQVIKEMNLLEGIAAVGAIHPATPDKLLLLRDQSPLVIGATKDMLMFASDKTTIHKSLRPWIKIHNIWMKVHAPDLSFIPMPNQSGWIIGPNGLEAHGKFEANGQHRTGTSKYTTIYNYHDRKAKADKDAAALSATGSCSTEKKPPVSTTDSEPEESEGAQLPRFVVCPNIACNRCCELEMGDRSVEALSLLACADCGTNLVDAVKVPASFEVN